MELLKKIYFIKKFVFFLIWLKLNYSFILGTGETPVFRLKSASLPSIQFVHDFSAFQLDPLSVSKLNCFIRDLYF